MAQKNKVGVTPWSACIQLRILHAQGTKKLQQRHTRCNTKTADGDYHIEEKWVDVPTVLEE